MVEETLPTFEAYCKHQELSVATTIVDEKMTKHRQVIEAYAEFATEAFHEKSKPAMTKPIVIRWKTVGLRALKATVDAETFGLDSGQQLNTVLPVILDNLYADNNDIFLVLQAKAQESEKAEVEQGRKRRMSTTTVSTVDTIDTNALTAGSTTADADKVAEDEVRVLAVRCLKQIFSVAYGTNRGQLRLATSLTLQFIVQRKPPRLGGAESRHTVKEGNWATSLLETVARWAPVQDRFIILVTAVDTLIRSPVVEEDLEAQLPLAELIDWLLGSSINMIGLSVMDVLIGFVNHILQLLQLGGSDSRLGPHQQQSIGLYPFKDAQGAFASRSAAEESERGRHGAVLASTPSPVRQELLLRIQKCIGDLATHIYYTDQVSDMIVAVLHRLKPSAQSDISSVAAAIENPVAAANAIANSASLQEDSSTDTFFSFATARVTALKAVKDILIVANFRKSMTGSAAESRSRVGLNVWEGTQWLLRDAEREVRFAYVDAFCTWLRLETNRSDLQLTREDVRRIKSESRKHGPEESKLAKRAVSNASRTGRKIPRSKFLQLLHLAVYENAIDGPADVSNILLLHLVLSSTVERLGVNAIRFGLPVIFRLQDDLIDRNAVEAPGAWVGIGSLIHGYLGAISEKFDFETSWLGTEIHNEIVRRKQKGLWLDGVRFPALPLDQIPVSDGDSNGHVVSQSKSDDFRPVTNRAGIVDEIARAYNNSLISPPHSPPSSPGGVFSVPSLTFGYGTVSAPKPALGDQLPDKAKEEMMASWTRESCLASVEKDSAQTSSLSGSKTGTNSLNRNYLAVGGNENPANGTATGNNSPMLGSDQPKRHSSGHRPSSGTYGLIGGLGLGSFQNLRRISTQDGSAGFTPSSSHESTVRVNELKRVLSNTRNGVRHSSPLRARPKSRPGTSARSSDSESMMTYDEADGGDGSALEIGAHADPDSRTEQSGKATKETTFRHDGHSRNSSVGSVSSLPTTQKAYVRPGSWRKDDDIPPVPKIPSSLNLPGGYPKDGSPVRPSSSKSEHIPQRSPSSAFNHKLPSKSRPVSRKEKTFELDNLFNHRADLGKLLAGIEPGVGGSPLQARNGLGTPPY